MSIDSIISLILTDKRLSALRKKIVSGKGTFSDTFDYTSYSANLMGQLFSGEVLDMPEEERKSTCISLLRDRYTDINALLDTTQRALDKAQGLALAPRHVSFDEERAAQIGDSLIDKTVPDETIVRRAGSAPVTAVRSMHDDYIEENAEFRSKAGLQCYINRVTDGKCCKWCSKMAGRFEYGDEPDGIFRRHDNCGCSVTYECGRQRQNVWTKKTWEVPEPDAGTPPPTVLSHEQARRLEQQRLAQFRGLRFNSSSIDNSGESGIIESKKITPATEQEIADFKASLLEMGFADVTGFENYTESNEHLLEIIEDFGKLKADFPDYFKGLKLDFGTVKEMTDNDYAGYVPGTGTIHLNPVFYNNFEKMQKEYSSDVSRNYHPAGTDYRATIFHEFGHRVEHISESNPKKNCQKGL